VEEKEEVGRGGKNWEKVVMEVLLTASTWAIIAIKHKVSSMCLRSGTTLFYFVGTHIFYTIRP
jgi:hypothetical protein